jgi:hypothetical protein
MAGGKSKGLTDKQLDDFIKRLHQFETTKGSAKGTGLTISQYTGGKANDQASLNKLVKNQYLKQVEKELGGDISNLDTNVLLELLDYKFNTGRNVGDLLSYANGTIDLNQINSSSVFGSPKDISNISIDNVKKAKHDVYKTTNGYTLQNPNPAYNLSWSNRIGGMYDSNTTNPTVNQETSIDMNIDEIQKKVDAGVSLNESEKAFYRNNKAQGDIANSISTMQKLIAESNLGQAEKEALRKQLIFDRDVGSVDAFNATQGALDIGKTAFGLSQINKGRNQLEFLEENRPQISPFDNNQNLERRLYEANRDRQQGLSGATKQMYEQQLLDDAMRGQRMAELSSGGQAGLYGALSQNQAQQRAMERMKFASMNEQAKAQGARAYDTLLANQMNESEEMRQRRDADQIRKQADWKGNLQGARALQNVGTENILNVAEMQPYRAGNYAKQYFNTDAQRNPGYFDAISQNNLSLNNTPNFAQETDAYVNEFSGEMKQPLDGFPFKYGVKKKKYV